MSVESVFVNKKRITILKNVEWGLVFYLFFVIFSPPILPEINVLIPITIYSIYSIFKNYRYTFLDVLKKSKLYSFFKLYAVCYGLVFSIVIANIVLSGEFYILNFATNVYRLIFLMGALLICITYFIVVAESKKLSFYDILKTFLMAMLLQFFIGILAFLSPEIKKVLLTVMQKNTGSDVYFREGLFSYGYTYRYNGFAGTLLDTFGYGMGLASGILAILGFYKNFKYLIFFLLLLIPSMLNSRTGILFAALGFAIAFVGSLFKSTPKRIIKQFIGTFLLFIVVGLVFYLASLNSPKTVAWIIDGFESFYNLFTGNEVRAYSTADQLFSDRFWVFPEDLKGMLFGKGYRLYGMGTIINKSSDVGYINHLWLAGITGMILMYVPFIYLFATMIVKRKFNFSTTIAMYLTISFFIMLVKGDSVGYNTGMFINLFVPLIMTYDGFD